MEKDGVTFFIPFVSRVDFWKKLKMMLWADGGDIILIDIKCPMQKADKPNWVFSDINQINWHEEFLDIMNIGCCPNQLQFKCTGEWTDLTVFRELGDLELGMKVQLKGPPWSFVNYSWLLTGHLSQADHEFLDRSLPPGFLKEQDCSWKFWWGKNTRKWVSYSRVRTRNSPAVCISYTRCCPRGQAVLVLCPTSKSVMDILCFPVKIHSPPLLIPICVPSLDGSFSITATVFV